MLRITTLSLITALSAGLLTTADAAVIYDATTANTTNFSNNNNGTTAANVAVTGASPDLLLALDGGNFFTGGFGSTDDINTLNGSALTATDTVVVQFTVDGVSHTGTFARFGNYRRAGVLVNEGYSGAPEILYCPSFSNTHQWVKPGGVNPSNASQSGWFEDDTRPASVTNMQWSYHYRETYIGREYAAGSGVTNAQLRNTLNIDRDPSDLVMFADRFADPIAVLDHHETGYNYSNLDGSGDFHLDDGREFAIYNGGSAFNTNVRWTEIAYETFRRGYRVQGGDLFTEF